MYWHNLQRFWCISNAFTFYLLSLHFKHLFQDQSTLSHIHILHYFWILLGCISSISVYQNWSCIKPFDKKSFLLYLNYITKAEIMTLRALTSGKKTYLQRNQCKAKTEISRQSSWAFMIIGCVWPTTILATEHLPSYMKVVQL